jgi:hypothetical protein
VERKRIINVAIVKTINALLCLGLFRSIAGNSFFSDGVEAILFFLEIIIPAGIIINPSKRNPGKIMYMNNPRFVSFLLKIVEIRNNAMISKILMDAISKPIIVIQFLEADGSFIELGIKVKAG